MKQLLAIIILLSISCSHRVTLEDVGHLNGYWEIEEVHFPDGGKKDYPMNTIVDYIEVNGLEGYRKKMVPKWDGGFETSDDAETFMILQRQDSLIFKYENPMSTWEESLLSLSEDNFSVKNTEGIIYQFKRFEPINLRP